MPSSWPVLARWTADERIAPDPPGRVNFDIGSGSSQADPQRFGLFPNRRLCRQIRTVSPDAIEDGKQRQPTLNHEGRRYNLLTAQYHARLITFTAT